MNRYRKPISIALPLLFWLIFASNLAFAGEFGATFNCRLDCQYSSWHEGEVIKVTRRAVTIRIIKDLLRHALVKSFAIKSSFKPKKGDAVLVNYWAKPKKIDYTKFPNSMPWGPQVLAKINKKDTIMECAGYGYTPSILGWFYWSGRWDARIKSQSMKNGGYCWYAVLPSGKQVLLYNEKTHEGLYLPKKQ